MSRLAIRTAAVVEIPGVCPNWSQWRGNSIMRDAAKKPWRELAWYAGQSARHAARWPLPEKSAPPARRLLEVAIYKMRPFYDEDGAMSSLKPLIDGLVRVLLVDDSPAWCGLLTAPVDLQHEVSVKPMERTVITIHLVDPRNSEPAHGH